MSFTVTKKSFISGITRTKTFKEYTQEEYESRNKAWKNGEFLIQDAFPHLSDADREFLMSGITDEEWDAEFGDGDEDE